MLTVRSFLRKQAADLRSQIILFVDGEGSCTQRRWCRRLSLLITVFPVAVLVYGGLTGHPFFTQIWGSQGVRNVWIMSAAVGGLLGLRASALARWSKDDAGLVLLHLGGVLFIWFASYLPYVGHPD